MGEPSKYDDEPSSYRVSDLLNDLHVYETWISLLDNLLGRRLLAQKSSGVSPSNKGLGSKNNKLSAARCVGARGRLSFEPRSIDSTHRLQTS